MISTPPPSPITMPLTLPSMASVFVKLQRAKDRSKSDSLDFSSGEPQTHPSCLSGESAMPRSRDSLVHTDIFTCKGAVDVPKLLRASRASLLEKAEYLGANVLVDERCVFHVLAACPLRWLTLPTFLLLAGDVQYVCQRFLGRVRIGFGCVLCLLPFLLVVHLGRRFTIVPLRHGLRGLIHKGQWLWIRSAIYLDS